MTNVLILAGSAEGHALARRVPGARTLLAEPLRNDAGGVAYEIARRWDAETVTRGAGPVVLATHPCDPALRADLPAACAARGRPLLHLCRPAWRPGLQDIWHLLGSDAELPGPLPDGARVFVGLGREVARFRDRLEGRYLVIRQLAGPERSSKASRDTAWPGHGHYLEGTAPFSVDAEIETLRAERIDWLLLRNAGGAGGWPKLAAARALGLPVVLLPRPDPMPGVPVAETVDVALDWLASALSGKGTAGLRAAPDRGSGTG